MIQLPYGGGRRNGIATQIRVLTETSAAAGRHTHLASRDGCRWGVTRQPIGYLYTLIHRPAPGAPLMVAAPHRRPDPTPHLGAHIVPLERALRARAEAIENDPEPLALAIGNAARQHGVLEVQSAALASALGSILAGEFRHLADELHHW